MKPSRGDEVQERNVKRGAEGALKCSLFPRPRSRKGDGAPAGEFLSCKVTSRSQGNLKNHAYEG